MVRFLSFFLLTFPPSFSDFQRQLYFVLWAGIPKPNSLPTSFAYNYYPCVLLSFIFSLSSRRLERRLPANPQHSNLRPSP